MDFVAVAGELFVWPFSLANPAIVSHPILSSRRHHPWDTAIAASCPVDHQLGNSAGSMPIQSLTASLIRCF
jgi:hypothetical protein